MSVDFRALTISFDVVYVVYLAVQVLLCAFLLIRYGRSLPSCTAVIILLGGIIVLLGAYSTMLAEDVRKRVFLPGTLVDSNSIGFQLAEPLLDSFGYMAVLVPILIMLYRSVNDVKNQAWMGKIVEIGGVVLIVRLGLAIGGAVYTYQSNYRIIYNPGGLSGYERIQDTLAQRQEAFEVHRGLDITDLVFSGILIIVLVLGGILTRVQRLRNAIVFGLIPALSVQLVLGAIYAGIYYTGQHRGLPGDILGNAAYVYTHTILSNVSHITVPACVMYAGLGWNAADLSYVTQPSVEDIEGES